MRDPSFAERDAVRAMDGTCLLAIPSECQDGVAAILEGMLERTVLWQRGIVLVLVSNGVDKVPSVSYMPMSKWSVEFWVALVSSVG